MKKNKRGISLIVLIVTIIVIIILAAAVILTLSKNNPVESAREARFKEDVRSFQDELSMYLLSDIAKDSSGIREKITTEDMPSKDVMNNYIESFSSKYENKLGIYEDELVYYKPDEEVKNKVTEKEEKWLQDLGIKLKVVETSEELFEWGSDDPNNPEYYTLKKYIGSKTNVIVPKRCHIVGNEAFDGNYDITSVTLQEGVTNIKDEAFGNCRNLKTVNLPDSLEYISSMSFYDTGLRSITIPPKVTYISSHTFTSCYYLEEVVFNNIEGIGEQAFSNCNSLKNIELPESITYIGRKAFELTGLSSVYLPSNLSSIGDGIFADCKNLVTIDVDENNPNYTSIDGVVYSKDKKRIVEFPAGKNLESYTVDDNVEYISNEAFINCSNLKRITLGNNVKSIGDYSFMKCTNLVDINIPSSLEEIKYNSFGVCSNLSNIYIPATIKKMGGIVFHMCYNLTIDCEFEENNIPSTWESNWYGSAKAINYGVKRED